jgi:hypothetical protein
VKDANEGYLVLPDMALYPDWKERFEVAVLRRGSSPDKRSAQLSIRASGVLGRSAQRRFGWDFWSVARGDKASIHTWVAHEIFLSWTRRCGIRSWQALPTVV